jgi:hypothetical protein
MAIASIVSLLTPSTRRACRGVMKRESVWDRRYPIGVGFQRGSGWSAAFEPTCRKPAATPTPPPDPSCAAAGWSQRIRRDVAVMEDAIALIDAMLDAGNRPFKIEQISFSEGYRLVGRY